MNKIWILFTLTLVIIASVVQAKDEVEELLDELSSDEFEDDEELLRNIEQSHVDKALERESEHAREIYDRELKERESLVNGQRPVLFDPCAKIHCGAGKICKSEGETAECICIPDCPQEKDPRRKVCTSKNETWDSDCEVHRQRCLCDTKSAACLNKEYHHIQIDYYGECRDMPECSDEEMNDFPRRMRDWLFNVMRDLAERKELPDHYLQMQMEAETNMTKRWINAAVWKWCDLDESHDHSVSLHELFPIRAPLMSLEHCIAPFLETCDPDNNHRITLKEWGKCLELEEGELYEQCEDVRKSTVSSNNV